MIRINSRFGNYDVLHIIFVHAGKNYLLNECFVNGDLLVVLA